MDHPDEIVCLVGENPLPVYLGARQFANKDCTTVVLLHSEQTKEQASRIESQLTDHVNESKCVSVDAYNPKSVTSVVSGLKTKLKYQLLNYTGGTKVMAAFAVKAWADDTTAFYLDEGEAKFWFGNGTDRELSGNYINTDVLCELHGVVVKHRSNHDFENSISTDTLHKLFDKWPRPKRGTPYNRAPFMPDTWGDLGVTDADCAIAVAERWAQFKEMSGLFPKICAPTSAKALKEGDYKHQYKFAATTWQELLVQKSIEKCEHKGFIKGTYFDIGGQDFEADLIGVWNNRLYYISCTTDHKVGMVKAKAFEAVYRARQLGGGMARIAVVSFANDNDFPMCL